MRINITPGPRISVAVENVGVRVGIHMVGLRHGLPLTSRSLVTSVSTESLVQYY